MREAETVLGIIRERGQKGLPLEDIYRQLFNPHLYLMAYSKIYSNDGAMTPGTTRETADGMSMVKIERLIKDIRQETYHWTPVRRVYIPKTNGKTRPLGITTWSDKLLQEIMRLILEAYYEPQFSPRSNGFRPKRGCRTALNSITTYWTGTKWYIEGDISKYFDTISHGKLIDILREKLKDNRFIRLIENLLKAGYLEDWKWHQTLSGTPQGSGVSPILANIYLDRFDKYVENELIPEYTNGAQRTSNAEYRSLQRKIIGLRKKGEIKEAQKLWVKLQKMPSLDTKDPNYRRLRYVRYADDTLMGLIGTKAEAEEIKRKIKEWLHNNLELELSEEKTLITHAQTKAAKFLGYEIVTQQSNEKHTNGRRSINGIIGLRVPSDVIQKKCARYMRKGKAAHRNELINDADFSIISKYQDEYRGIVTYYKLAVNVSWFNKLHYVMQGSLLRTLARKHKTRLTAMKTKYKAQIDTPHGPMSGLRMEVAQEGKQPLVAQFGGIPLRRDKKAVLRDINPEQHYSKGGRTEIIKRLLANECEICGSTEKVEVHHIRKLTDLKKDGRKEKPAWVQRMAIRKRKTLMVCRKCHNEIHAGKSQKPPSV